MSSYNLNSRKFEQQIVITDTTPASATSGSLVVNGGLSTKDTQIRGRVVVNNVDITPNLNDIVLEQEFELLNNVLEPTNITNFIFNNSLTTSFKAIVNVNVNTGISKYAIWEINGIFKSSVSNWFITSTFSGDITGVSFSIDNDNGIGRMRYTNTNTTGTTTIRFRASTNAPIGSQPTNTVGVVYSTSGPYVANKFIYANTANTFASTDIDYDSSVLTLGGNSRILARNANDFTNYSNGGAITSMGDASVAKKLIVGSKIGINNTSPTYQLDISGDINFTGQLRQNGDIYVGGASALFDTQGDNVYITTGNFGIGTTDPQYSLDVSGSIYTTETVYSSSLITGNISSGELSRDINLVNLTSPNIKLQCLDDSGIQFFVADSVLGITSSNIFSPAVIVNTVSSGNIYASTLVSSASIVGGTISSALLATSTLTGGNMYLSNDLFVGGTLTTVNVTTTNLVDSNITTGTLHITNYASMTHLTSTNIVGSSVSAGTINATTSISSAALYGTNISSGGINASTITLSNTSDALGVTEGGSLTALGGIGIAKKLFVGGVSKFTDTTPSSSQSSAAVVIDGGLSIGGAENAVNVGNGGALTVVGGGSFGGDLYVGGSINGSGTSSSTYAYLTLTATEEAIHLSSGSLVTFGGITTQLDTNATSVTNGGALLVQGGASIGKDVYIGGKLTPGSISSLSGTIGTINATTITAANIGANGVSAGTINASGITTGNINFTGTLYQNGVVYVSSQWTSNTSTSALSYTAGPVTVTDIAITNASIGTINAATIGSTLISSGNIYTSNDLFIGGTLTTVNITSTNLLQTNVSSTNIFATTITAGNIYFTGDLYKNGVVYSGGGGGSGQWTTNGSMIYYSGGNVGIGTTNPTSALHVVGDIFATGDITAFSDIRLKSDVRTIDNSLDKLTKLRGVYYTNLNNDKPGVGVIAQEINEVLPEVVVDQGDYLSVAYGNIVGLLIEAVKEIKAELDELKTKLF